MSDLLTRTVVSIKGFKNRSNLVNSGKIVVEKLKPSEFHFPDDICVRVFSDQGYVNDAWKATDFDMTREEAKQLIVALQNAVKE